MPALNLESLDDPVMIDACTGFGQGQRSFEPPDQLQPMEAAELVNVDIRDGTATTRRGTETLGAVAATGVQGLFWYDTPSGERLVGIAGGASTRYAGGSWLNYATYTAPSETTQVCMAQLVEKLYFAAPGKNLCEWDDAALVDLGNTTSDPGNPPANISFIIAATGRLWAAGIAEAPDTLWASELLEAGATNWWETRGTIRIGQGEGDPITGLAEWDDSQIVVFKRNSIYVVKASPADTSLADDAHSLAAATVTKISDTIGCVSHRSIARVGSDIWFLSDGGVFSVGRVLAQTQREVKQSNSLAIQDYIDRINWTAASTAAAYFWDNRYFIAVPLDDATSPSDVLVYNTLRQAWSGVWTGWAPTCWALSKESGNERLNFGRADGSVWRWLDYVPVENEVESTFQDAGASVATSITTRAMIFSDPIATKSALSVAPEFYASVAPATVAMRLNEEEPVTLRAGVVTSPGELLLPFTLPATLPGHGIKRRAFGAQQLPQFRSAQAVVTTTAGKLALRAVICTAFLNTFQLEE